MNSHRNERSAWGCAGRGPMDRRHFLSTLAAALPAVGVIPAMASSLPQALRAGVPVERLGIGFLEGKVDILPRRAWTRIAPLESRMERAERYTRITVHHSGSSVNVHEDFEMVAFDIEGILSGHQKRRFGDIGYHFILDRAGRVWEGRSLRYVGAHVSAANRENIGVMLLGNFEYQEPSARQLAALRGLTLALRERFNVDAGEVFGHRDLGHTLCPGHHLYGEVGTLRHA